MEQNNLDVKKWKRRSAEFKSIIRGTPKNEHTVYFVNFKTGELENKLDHSESATVLTFGSNKPQVKPKSKKKSKNNDPSDT